jgi:O-antigen/teichoic acid export membrane protein
MVLALALASLLLTVCWPAWVLVAEEDFSAVSIGNTLARVVSLAMLLLFVRHSDQLERAAFCLLSPVIVSMAFGLPRLIRSHRISRIGWDKIHPGRVLVGDFWVALSNWATFGFTVTPIFLAKGVLDPFSFGIFAFSDRFRSLASVLLALVTQVMFSRYSFYMGQRDARANRIAKMSLAMALGLSVVILGAVWLFGGILIDIIGSKKFLSARYAMIILMASLPAYSFNMFVSQFSVFSFNFAKEYMAICLAVIAAGLLFAILGGAKSPVELATIYLTMEIARAAITMAIFRLYRINPIRPVRSEG